MRRLRISGSLGLALAVTLFGAGAGCGGSDVPPARAGAAAVADEEEWEDNAIPVIEWVRLEPASPAAGASVTAQVRVADADGDELEIGYAWSLNGRPARVSGQTLPLGSAMKGDTVSVTVTASDGWDESDPFTTNTAVGNTPPLIQGVTFDPLGTIHRGQRVTARPIARDEDGDPLEFSYTWWVNDQELSSESDELDTSRLSRGDEVRVRVIASDGFTRSAPLMSQPIRVENSPPKIVSTPRNLGADGVYRYEVEAEDPDGDRRLRFRLEDAPPGMVIDPISGALSWTPPADATGTHSVEVVVDDLQGGVASQRFTVVIAEPEPVVEQPAQTAAVAPASLDEDALDQE